MTVSSEIVSRWPIALLLLPCARAATAFLEDCTPGYYNNEGKLSERSVQNGFYGGGPGSVEFIQILESWREDDTLQGLEAR